MEYSLQKQHKLLYPGQFKAVFNQNDKIVMPGFVLLAKKSRKAPSELAKSEFAEAAAQSIPSSPRLDSFPRLGLYPRLGLVVSKKTGNSVVRNRVKRQMREVFRLTWRKYAAQLSSVDFVLISRPVVQPTSTESMFSQFEKSLSILIKRWNVS
ncbi:MAG: ribonuclease P protein component [Oligoflexales bacterium]|nr:ribonuclease P protein component [Oligoflexales bacterium]